MTEVETLRSALRMQLAWLKHWQDDVKFNLHPTMDSLADAEDAINEALRFKAEKQLEAAE